MKKLSSLKVAACLALCAACACQQFFALPGFVPFIADRSGEYVYYRDNTFRREAYVGFLAYDEATYAARYYAPADLANGLFEENILIYFSLDPSRGYVHMTGERIATPVSQEQADIVNYLHDLVYEFGARRIKAGGVNPETAKLFSAQPYAKAGLYVEQDFAQFGGTVHVVFDFLVPLFNIKKIISNDNKALFEIVATGALRSSEDTSFAAFSVAPDERPGTSSWRADKTLKKSTFKMEGGQSVVLDAAWERPMDNLWLLGDVAILSMADVSSGLWQLLRMSMYNADWKTLSLAKKSGGYTLSAVYRQQHGDAATRIFRVITERGDSCAVFLLTIFNSVYDANRSYFDGIVKSYSAK